MPLRHARDVGRCAPEMADLFQLLVLVVFSDRSVGLAQEAAARIGGNKRKKARFSPAGGRLSFRHLFAKAVLTGVDSEQITFSTDRS